MTIYEQIQRGLDFIEAKLFSELSQERAARESGMSARGFNRWFWAVTGFSYKEYVVRRRLREASRLLASSRAGVLEVALSVGYRCHESFSRAFKKEFGVSPLVFRRSRQDLEGVERIQLIKEMYMGVVIKELPEMIAVAFEGFVPEPENAAKAKLEAWLAARPDGGKPRRIFGHNIDLQGRMDWNPHNVGYKFLASIDERGEADGAKVESIAPGRFAVTGIEGSIVDDPTGAFIMEGWKRMSAMVAEKGFKAKSGARWFEEELEPEKPGNLRLDLYLEIE